MKSDAAAMNLVNGVMNLVNGVKNLVFGAMNLVFGAMNLVNDVNEPGLWSNEPCLCAIDKVHYKRFCYPVRHIVWYISSGLRGAKQSDGKKQMHKTTPRTV
jgi:iron uptake system EfeUOB component EfeO/EfeM